MSLRLLTGIKLGGFKANIKFDNNELRILLSALCPFFTQPFREPDAVLLVAEGPISQPLSSEKYDGLEVGRLSDGKHCIISRLDGASACLISGSQWRAFRLVTPRLNAAASVCMLNVLRAAIETAASHHDTAFYNSIAIVTDGLAMCLNSRPGFDQSGLVYEWLSRRHGSTVISGTAPAVFPSDGGLYLGGSPWDGSDGFGINEIAPLAAVVEFKPGATGRLRRLYSTNALITVMQYISKPAWCESAFGHVTTMAGSIAVSVPVYTIASNSVSEAVSLLETAISGNTGHYIGSILDEALSTVNCSGAT